MTGATALNSNRIDSPKTYYGSFYEGQTVKYNNKDGKVYRYDSNGKMKEIGDKVKSGTSAISYALLINGKWYYRLRSYDMDYFTADELTPFDTGGYTGDWGPEGRLAMLHQKEIVLNAHDTENFLAAIGIVRDISDQIEKNAIVMQYQNQLANYRASVGNNGETLQ
jgi:hypothetical protein